MRLPHPFIQLPLRFDAERLAREVATIEERYWRPHPQRFPGNSMLPLISANGDPTVEYFAGPMQPTPYLECMPYLWQTFASVGAIIGRSRLMRLAGHAEVLPHADHGYYWIERTRIHIPIVTQPSVRFHCDDAVVNMAAGECWLFDTWRKHMVVNDNDDQRIHLVIDTVGGPRMWDLAARGRPVSSAGPQGDLSPELVAYDESARPSLPLENVNVPVIMSPWEIERHLTFLLGEAEAAPAIRQLRKLTEDLVLDWRALWARHGADPDAKAEYAARLDLFVEAARPLAMPVTFANSVNLFKAMHAMVGITAASGRTDKLKAMAADRA
jgi:hypothetical protein